jgi:hypothetical protein
MVKTLVAILIVGAMPAISHAAKCRGGKSILYTQDEFCPPGYTNITTMIGGNVSTIGKSEAVKRQEQEFLRQRAQDEQQNQVKLAHEQQQIVAAENDRRYLCNGLAVQARSLENQMRQINAWQVMDTLNKQHKDVRDEQYRLRC